MREDGRKKLGEILVAEGLVSPEQIERAVSRQDTKGKKLGKVLIDMGLTTEEEIAAALCKQLGLKMERLEDRQPSHETLKLLDKNFVTKNLVFPLEARGGKLVAAVSDPLNYKALDEAAHLTGLKIEPVVCTEKDILECIERNYKINDVILRMLKEFRIKQEVQFVALPQNEEADVAKIFSVNESSPAVKLLAFIFMDAFNKNANDVYIEPAGDKLGVRYRIEGDLYNIISMPGSIADTILYYVKLIANLDYSIKNPQSGKSDVLIAGKAVELEVSTLPMVTGERVKIRLRYKDRPAPTFSTLEAPSETVAQLRRIAAEGQGLILFSGPRNSGKRSVMYALLQELPKGRKDIVAAESRPENRLEGITQVSLGENSKTVKIKNLLKQGPDVVMIDELKDAEIAALAFEAANSGALVLSSIQAKNAADAISRVLNFGLEPWLVASNLLAVTSQRLIRKICTHCQEVYEPDVEHLIGLGFERPEKFMRGAGCRYCFKSGYKGHEGLLQVSAVSSDLKERILARSGVDALFQAIADTGDASLLGLAWEKVLSGVTTPEEALEKADPGLLRPLKKTGKNTAQDQAPPKEASSSSQPAPQKIKAVSVPAVPEPAAPELTVSEPAVPEPAAPELASPELEVPETAAPEMEISELEVPELKISPPQIKQPEMATEKPHELISNDGFGEVMRQKKILLAMPPGQESDDVRNRLADEDFDVFISVNGTDALKMIYSDNPDILICDLLLPELSGLTAYKKLYDSSRKILPVISITNNKTEFFSDEEQLLGTNVQIKRPLDFGEIFEKINQLLNEKPAKRDWKVL